MHIPTKQHELFNLFAQGKQTGFAGVLSALQGAQVINAQVSAWNAMDWTVTLQAMRNGNVPQTGLVAGVPPDNQVAIALGSSGPTAPPEIANYNIRGIYVRLYYGAGNSQETVFVSWPWGGCTLQMHGALVRVEIPSGFDLGNLEPGQFLPLLQGFITPEARRDGGMLSPPTLQTSVKVMADADAQTAGVDFFAPPRACGYRLYTASEVDVTFSPLFRVTQVLWRGGLPADIAAVDGVNVSLYRSNSNALDQRGDGSLAQNRVTAQPNDWRRFLPGSVGVHVDVTNPQDGQDVSVGVEWILDLG
jgi:hypothetical protein